MAFSLINWWAVLVGTVLNMVVGFLWYGPLFGRIWLRLMDKRPDEIQGGENPVTYVIPMAGAFVSAVALATVIGLLRVFTLSGGAGWGAMLWFAFGGTGLLTTGVFEDRKAGLSWLFIAYMVIVHAAQGAMFAVWR
ncbi:MAG: DUF1761 domain-containing protein [Alkalispirochaeta sp.]